MTATTVPYIDTKAADEGSVNTGGAKPDATYVTDLPAQDVALRPLVKDSFSYLSVFSLAFSCINSWVAIIYGLSAGLNSGGPTARKLVRVLGRTNADS
jgi:hypothetical protein